MTRSSIWKICLGVAAVAAVTVGGAAFWSRQHAKAVAYVTAPVERGAIRRTITASGSVNPEVTVQVGAFVSGSIKSLTCDYNTQVKKGQVCATIDPRPYQLTVDQDRAAVQSAVAQLGKDEAGLRYATLTYNRAAKLLQQGWVSRDAVDSARSLRDQAQAQIALDQGAILQRKAALRGAVVNLGYTDIVSPVDGVVVSRNVTVGQTVASSFQTPTLFLIAKDLARIQVDTNVSESDIAAATPGLKASFTVDAFPGQVFRGKVVQVRQAPISVQNVITYDVVIAAENPDLLLKPGMTATARIIVAERADVLRVPVQALHFTPAADAPTASTPAPSSPRQTALEDQQVWVLENGAPRRVAVTVGMDDDVNAEITGGSLKVGDRVLVSANQPAKAVRARSATATPARFGP